MLVDPSENTKQQLLAFPLNLESNRILSRCFLQHLDLQFSHKLAVFYIHHINIERIV